MGESDDQERRRSERVAVNSPFADMPSTTYISDLSEGGVFIHTRRRVPIGTIVDLHFTVVLEDPFVLGGTGEVVRHSNKPPGMGIRFIDPSPELILRINDVVRRQRPIPTGPPAQDPLDDEQTVHRAPIPAHDADDELESLKTGVYPSIKIQIHDFDSAEFDDDEPTTTVSNSTMQLSASEIEEIVSEDAPTVATASDLKEQTVDLEGSEVEFIRRDPSDDD